MRGNSGVLVSARSGAGDGDPGAVVCSCAGRAGCGLPAPEACACREKCRSRTHSVDGGLDKAVTLITDEYRALQAEMHRDPAYGVASIGYAPLVAKIIQQTESHAILDYGAGKGRLHASLKRILSSWECEVFAYDPAIPEISRAPSPCRFVVSIDVLEHIEPDCLDAVLDDLARVTFQWGFFTVHTGPAVKTLPDGRNAHLIQKPVWWWLPKLMERFDLLEFKRGANGFWVFVIRR